MQNNDEDEILSQGDVAHYVALIREGNPDIEGSKGLLRLFCARAKNLKFLVSPFPEPLLELLVSAFENYLSGKEKDIEKSLGLKRRGRPVSRKIQQRNVFIAIDVLRLHLEGKPLTDNRDEQGAFSTIADNSRLSDSEVRDIYYKHYDDAMSIITWCRWLENDSA